MGARRSEVLRHLCSAWQRPEGRGPVLEDPEWLDLHSRPVSGAADGVWLDKFGIPGLDGTPSCAVFFAGDVIVGGNFHHADGQRTNYIARWDGRTWHPMGAGFSYPVEALAVWKGRLVAGGGFYSSGPTYTGPIAVWNGVRWDPLGQGISGWISSIAVNDSELVIGGTFDRIDKMPVGNVARWNGSAWDPMGGGTDGPVLAITAYRGSWVVGGHFGNAGTTSARNVALWDRDMWRPLDRGISVTVNEPIVLTLATLGDELIAGGQFDSAGSIRAGGIGRWNGNRWDALPGAPHTMLVSALASEAGTVHIGGWSGDELPLGNRFLANWNGVSFAREPVGPNGMPMAIALADGDIVIAGAFERVGDRAMLRVARRRAGAWNSLAAWQSSTRGLSGPVLDFARFEGRVVAVGGFSFAAADTGWVALDGTAAWDGERWRPMGGLGASGAGELVIQDGVLYKTDGQVQRWTGTTWKRVGGSVLGAIFRLTSYNGQLWGGGACFGSCGGGTGLWRLDERGWAIVAPPEGVPGDTSFVTAFTIHGGRLVVAWAWGPQYWQPRTRISTWDGHAWSNVPGVFEGGQISGLGSFRGELCAGGDFRSVDGQPRYGFCMLEGSSWDSHGWSGRVDALEATDSVLVVAGSRLALFDGATWTFPEARLQGQAVALLADGPSLWLGGLFDEAGGHASSGVARWDGLPTPSMPAPQRANVAPNPFQNGVALRFTLSRASRVRLTILDVAGREVTRLVDAERPAGELSLTWDGRNSAGRAVPDGFYVARLELNGRPSHVDKLIRIR